MDIIKTTLLLGDNGREFDMGSLRRSTIYLSTLSKEDAISRFKAGKRVFFIYQNERIYHENCRKVAKNALYIQDHYDFYHEVCGCIASKKLLSNDEYNVLNLLASKSKMDCWFYLENDRNKDVVHDLENDQILPLADGISQLADGLCELDSYNLTDKEKAVATILFERFGCDLQ